jgi:hypothetical protein
MQGIVRILNTQKGQQKREKVGNMMGGRGGGGVEEGSHCEKRLSISRPRLGCH